ncbi:MAG: hypothetical protein JWO89_3826 [Verrucomicrobiaceae bacterium]|nr:hypothetical protein [Verrucomicrobiaceae bacterium]
MRIGAVILAAGGSFRLGHAKQLLRLDGEGLLRRSVRVGLQSKASNIVVVLGAEANVCAAEIADLPVRITIHSTWRNGIASSIVAGLQTLRLLDPGLEGVVFMVCDQPHLTTEVIDSLIHAHQVLGKGVIACRYGEITGVPALFGKAYFEAISGLTGDQGARSLFHLCEDDLACISFPEGCADIDTREDYERYLDEAHISLNHA